LPQHPNDKFVHFIWYLLFFVGCSIAAPKGKEQICHWDAGANKFKLLSVSVASDHVGKHELDKKPLIFPDPQNDSDTITTCDPPCSFNPCLNGVCSDTPTPPYPYTCTCNNGWIGYRCETHICSTQPCKNEGTCSPSTTETTGYSCQCTEGWTGPNCEFDTSCSPSCSSDQKCVNHVCAGVGNLFFRLEWVAIDPHHDDMDLFVETPTGNLIYYTNPGPSTDTDFGTYDRDSFESPGPENIYWASSYIPPSGPYHVCVNIYAPTPVAEHPSGSFTITYGVPGNEQVFNTGSTTSLNNEFSCDPTTPNFMFTYTYP